MSTPVIQSLGDAAVLITFAAESSRDVALCVRRVAESITSATIPGVTDVVPAYVTLAVFYDDAVIDRNALEAILSGLCAADVGGAAPVSRLIEIPVRYDGPDLGHVAEQTGLSVADVIERHFSRSYYAYILGFVPGFAYLGDLDAALILPRLSTPRLRVPSGSVAIAGAQTAVYPLDSPGGWHLIGSTMLTMFDPLRDSPALLRAGDTVRFIPVE